MEYKQLCVTDKEGFYKCLVLVYYEEGSDGNQVQKIKYYELNEGEKLVDTIPPGSVDGKPRWNDEKWINTIE